MRYNWDAKTYSKLTLPHMRWGEERLSRYSFNGSETVLEAGCGAGRDTEKLAIRVPEGKVIAMDSSESMISVAKAKINTEYPNVEFVLHDLKDPFRVEPNFDLIFSVATFHWIHDHERIFANLAGIMTGKGVFLADFGGKGNIASITDAISKILGPTPADLIWNFADVSQTEYALVKAGFDVREVSLIEDPAYFDSKQEFRDFISTLILGAHMSMVHEDEREDFVSNVVSLLSQRRVDYVRIKVDAVKK